MFDIIFEILIVTVGYAVGRIAIPALTFGKIRSADSPEKSRNRKTGKQSKKWYGEKRAGICYLSVELTGLIGLIIITGIIVFIAFIIH
ncbi:MAG TPA: hypothetical protein PK358_07195 [Spirochaetota bacterium]|nr:hypothetical protein [Spirochaetota bacterium]